MTLTGFIGKLKSYFEASIGPVLAQISAEDGVALSDLVSVFKTWSDPYSLPAGALNALFLLPGVISEDDEKISSVPVDLVFVYQAAKEPEWQTACHDVIKRLIQTNPDFSGICFESEFVKTTPYEPVNGIGITHTEIVLKVDSLF